VSYVALQCNPNAERALRISTDIRFEVPQPMPLHEFNALSPSGSAGSASITSIFAPRKSGVPDKSRRIALVGTFAPRKCGIATFTTDIFEQLGAFHPGLGIDVYAVDNPVSPLDYGPGIKVISQDCPEDYIRAAQAINDSGVDAVWLQHEFGIFGGDDGEMVCAFIDRIAAPIVLTLHTVSSEPTDIQRRILTHLISRASRIMVMSRHARDLLIERYRAFPETIDIIPHGAPDRPFGRSEQFKAEMGLSGRDVLMTFGLLSPGKGLERVIEALPAIVARHSNVIYKIVGATHPNLLAREGERYRDSLQALAHDLGVEDHIQWDNRFLDTEELLDQLEACDIYITPYFNLQQTTSGTLSYAVALGKAVVSTPYVHARELLAGDVGVLIEPDSSTAIAVAIDRLLDDRQKLANIQRMAYAQGRKTIWPAFADASARLVGRAIAPQVEEVSLTARPSISGVFMMSDATGMFQHSIGIIPDRHHGYCLDDNARALMLLNVAKGLSPDDRMTWSMRYASFIQHAWNPDLMRFRNFMRFDRSWCEEAGSDDSNGRALWALGQTVETAPDADIRRWALRWFDEVHPIFATVEAPRTWAFAMLGAASVLKALPNHTGAIGLLDRGGQFLHNLLDSSRRPDWAWFEAMLGYDNPRLPQALIEAGALLTRSEWISAGMETLGWIAERQVSISGNFRPIGSESFGMEHLSMPFDQQPLEAQAAVEGARSAYAVSGATRWIEHAHAAYRWFFGANDRGVVLADLATGRCRDGVTPRGVNENCGAESILAFQLAHHSMLAMLQTAPPESSGECIEPRSRSLGQSASHP
jgi:glycosyltransferase involved in cell wall biosynthesis